MLEVSFSISPVDLVSRSRSLPARSTKDTLPCRVCPKLGSCGKGNCNHENFQLLHPCLSCSRSLPAKSTKEIHPCCCVCPKSESCSRYRTCRFR